MITVLIVDKQDFSEITADNIQNYYEDASERMKNADFLELFKISGGIDSQPQLDLRSLKLIKANFIDVFID